MNTRYALLWKMKDSNDKNGSGLVSEDKAMLEKMAASINETYTGQIHWVEETTAELTSWLQPEPAR